MKKKYLKYDFRNNLQNNSNEFGPYTITPNEWWEHATSVLNLTELKVWYIFMGCRRRSEITNKEIAEQLNITYPSIITKTIHSLTAKGYIKPHDTDQTIGIFIPWGNGSARPESTDNKIIEIEFDGD